jgi:small subunit ribosomal protein S16
MGVPRIRLARHGHRNRPFYRVVAIDSRKRRDAKPIEYVSRFADEERPAGPNWGERRRRGGHPCPQPSLSPSPPLPTTIAMQLGTYDPLPFALDEAKEVRLAVDRIKYWLSVGAQPSDRVAYLLWRAGILPPPPIHKRPPPKKEGEEKDAAAGGSGAAAPAKAAPAAAAGAGAKKKFHTLTDAVLAHVVAGTGSGSASRIGAAGTRRVAQAGMARGLNTAQRLWLMSAGASR